MRYVTFGTVSSERELQEVVDRVDGEQVYDLAELVKTLVAAETCGFAGEHKRWAVVSGEKAIKVYSGVPGSSKGTIWAAIEVCDDGAIKLLKIVDSFDGGEQEAEGLLADAIHRRNRSIGS